MSKTLIVQSLMASMFRAVFDAQYLDDLQQKRSDSAMKESNYIDVNIDAASVDLTGVREVVSS